MCCFIVLKRYDVDKAEVIGIVQLSGRVIKRASLQALIQGLKACVSVVIDLDEKDWRSFWFIKKEADAGIPITCILLFGQQEMAKFVAKC